jgi:GT2 family glycosyltransferase
VVASIACIVVTYDDDAGTRETLTQLERLALGSPDVKFYAWDNKGWSFSATQFPSLRYLSSSTNVGFGRAVNRVVEMVTEEWLLLLNPDLTLTTEELEEIAARLRSSRADEMWSPQLLNPDGSVQTGPLPVPVPTPAQWVAGALGLNVTKGRSGHWYLRGAILAMHTSSFQRLGGFDERFFLYGEEVDLCVRAQDEGFTLRLDTTLSVVHAGSQGYKDKSPEALAELMLSRPLLSTKHFGRRRSRLVHPANLAAIALLLPRARGMSFTCRVGRRYAARYAHMKNLRHV